MRQAKGQGHLLLEVLAGDRSAGELEAFRIRARDPRASPRWCVGTDKGEAGDRVDELVLELQRT